MSAIPQEAATPALVIVGFLMLGQIRHIDFTDLADGIPAFLTIVLMPFTYSIVNGIGGGVITYTLIRIVTGRWREVPGLLWVISAAFVVYFAINPLSELLGVANWEAEYAGAGVPDRRPASPNVGVTGSACRS